LFATDALKVLYAPHKVFDKIIQNPKYWGPLLIFIIFLAAQSGFYYSLYSKTYYEQTTPNINNLGAWTLNSTMWTVSPGVAISSNYIDYLNSSIYGNSSMQFAISNVDNMSIALVDVGNVNCGPTGFQNLSMRIKQVDPLTAPSQATLTLYSLTQSNTYQYDLTNEFSDATLVGVWNNITVPLGTQASNWQAVGSPQWGNITGLKLDFTYASKSSVTLRVEGLFFRGTFESPVKTDFVNFLVYILQASIFQFVEEWLIFAALMYIIIKGMKGIVVWRPLFIAAGFALIVTVVQALINLAAISTLPQINYPVELLAGVPGEGQTLLNAISTQTTTYSLIANIVQLSSYVWTAALGAFIIRALLPEFKWIKSILVSASAFIVTVVVINFLALLGF
jgi:hypothetical protein